VEIVDDYVTALVNLQPSSLVYLDPPYFEAGPALYRHSFRREDHVQLATTLEKCSAQWLLSYDDHEEVKELYSWADVHSLRGYTQQGGKKKPDGPEGKALAGKLRVKYELLITRKT
jgi:site-specific DNA-adenine methylase